jgi:outer membrane protein TolC
MNSIRALLLFVLALQSLPALRLHAQAQQPRVLTLDECLRVARVQSPAAKLAAKTYEIGYWNYRSFRAGLRPQVRLNADLPGFTRRITTNILDDGTQDFVSQDQAYSSLGLSLVQPIMPTGGQLFVTSGLARLDIFQNPYYMSWQSTPVSVGLRQPLVSYNTWRWSQKIQPVRYEQSQRRYMEALEDISIQATNAFFNLYIAEIRLANAEFNLSINDSIYQISNGRFKVGKIAENDLLQTELQLLGSRLDVEQQRVAIQSARQDLAILLGLPPETEFKLIPPLEIPIVVVSEEVALNQASMNRSDILDFEARLIQAQSDLAQTRSNNRFSADLNASYGLNQTGSSLTQAYTKPLSAQSFSVGIDIPLVQWGRAKANVAAAQAQAEQVSIQVEQDRRTLEWSVRNEVRQFTLQSQNMVIASKADTIAQRRFEVARARYMIGKIDITNLQISQNEKDNARSSYMQTLRDYWVGYYRLRRATLFDFRENRQVQMPVTNFE